MKTPFIYIFISFLLVSQIVCAQKQKAKSDRIVFLSGKEYDIKLLDSTGNKLKVSRNDCFIFKTRTYSKGHLYAFIDTTEHQTVYYQEDTLFGNGLKETEMAEYVKGEQYAIANYKSKSSFYVGVGFGLAGAAFAIYSFSTFSPVIAGLGTVAVEIPGVDVEKVKFAVGMSNADNTPFLAGYIKQSKRKKLRNAAWGGLIGLVTGIPLVILANSR